MLVIMPYIHQEEIFLHKTAFNINCYEMQVQHQKWITPTISKDPVDDHNTYTEKKNTYTHYSLLYLQLLQRNQHLPSPNVGLLSPLSVTANLRSVCKTFNLTHPGTEKFKFAKHPRYRELLEDFKKDQMWYVHYTTNEILILKQIDYN